MHQADTNKNLSFDNLKPQKYENDIRDIVDYFEKNCSMNKGRVERYDEDKRSSPEIARYQKIESLINKVAENKS